MIDEKYEHMLTKEALLRLKLLNFEPSLWYADEFFSKKYRGIFVELAVKGEDGQRNIELKQDTFYIYGDSTYVPHRIQNIEFHSWDELFPVLEQLLENYK